MEKLIYKLYFYVPVAAVDTVKEALFAAGAGKIGHYDCCSWQTLGTGQFRALAGSNPTIGSIGNIEMVPEYKVEMIVEAKCLTAVIQALRDNHPYEEPTIDVIALANHLVS